MPTHIDTMTPQDLLSFAPEVAHARAHGLPVVALESTIIAHGMPYPQNVQTAREVEAIIRAAGATPATIAVLGGKLHIGLDDVQLEQLGHSPDALKLSRRDLAYGLSSGRVGATTVAATMMAAHLAGIQVFVTGGIGGVHRGAAQSFDISADLMELAHTPVAVVCAGAKSILDLPLTLEYLETQGVPVIAMDQDNLAAFYTPDSGLKADFRLDSATEQARFLKLKWALSARGGAVISNPVPAHAAMPKSQIDAITAQALDEAAAQGISGKAITPFLLARIKALTGGASLATNIALVKHNALVGARLAIALAA